MQANERLIACLGLAAWVVAGVVLLALHSSLSRHHELWWLETVGIGILLGLYGIRYTSRRAKSASASATSKSASESS